MYYYLFKISSEILILNFGYLSSGKSIFTWAKCLGDNTLNTFLFLRHSPSHVSAKMHACINLLIFVTFSKHPNPLYFTAPYNICKLVSRTQVFVIYCSTLHNSTLGTNNFLTLYSSASNRIFRRIQAALYQIWYWILSQLV